jgi:hypothetical protein
VGREVGSEYRYTGVYWLRVIEERLIGIGNSLPRFGIAGFPSCHVQEDKVVLRQ